MNKVTLYQYDSKGNIKLWSMEVIDNGNGTATMLSYSGLKDGKHTPDETIISEGKNQGKANETTPYTQAVADAQSKITGKIKKGYVEDITQIKASTELGSGIKSPMLAHKFDPEGKQSGSKTLKQLGLEGKTIIVQRKKDGNRGNIHITKDGVTMWSRKGEKLPILQHIADTITLPTDDTEYWLDGEFYTKAYSFNKLNGLVKKPKKTEQDLIDVLHIKFHLYDTFSSEGYEVRRHLLNQFASKYIHVEESHEIIATNENLQEWLEKFLAEGEEGLMIRVPGMAYEHKRSWSLLKFKIFEDAEFKIVGFEESVKGGRVGSIIVEMTAPSSDRDGNTILTFKAGVKFSDEECTEMWNNQQNYIGTPATVEFFGKSEYQVPRFPKAVKINRLDA